MMRVLQAAWPRLRTATLIAASLIAAGCSGDERPSEAEAPTRDRVQPTQPSAANAHISSLAVDPADGTLFLGTGLGLFQARGGRVTRVVGRLRAGAARGTLSSNVVVRFAGPGELLASGHPEDGTLPEDLGLIRSTDGGGTWRPVSLLGRADFHVLQVTGRRVVAVRADDDRVQVSGDGGRTFGARTAPAPPVDVAFDPTDPARLVVSTERGMFSSPDGGRGWRPEDPEGAGSQLAWHRSDALFRAGTDGGVTVSQDGGRSWRRRGSIGATPHELVTDAGGRLYASVPGGEVRGSMDGGTTWRLALRLR